MYIVEITPEGKKDLQRHYKPELYFYFLLRTL